MPTTTVALRTMRSYSSTLDGESAFRSSTHMLPDPLAGVYFGTTEQTTLFV